MDLAVGRQREHVDELNWYTVVRRCRRSVLEQLRADAAGEASRDAQQRFGLIFGRADAQPFGQFREYRRVGSCLPLRLDHRSNELQGDWSIPLGDVVVLQERGGRQDHIRVAGGIGEDLFEHDRKEIGTFQPLQHPILIGRGCQGIAVVDEQQLDRWVLVLEQCPAEHVHVDQSGRRLRRVDQCRPANAKCRRVAHREPAAANTELAGDGRQREHRRGGAAAIAIPLQPPSASDERRRALDVPVGQASQGLGRDPGFRGRPIDRPRGGRLPQLLGAAAVRREERTIGVSFFEQYAMDRERHRQIRSGLDGKMQIRLFGQAGASRIDDHQTCAGGLRLTQERNQMDSGCAGIDTPEDDQPGMRIIGIGDARHLAVERLVGRAGGSRTDRPRQS